MGKVYIHEYIDIIGHNRARYMHHMTANWCPIAREERNQLCFGIWGTVGSTGRWPQVVNLWEYEDWSAMAANFEHEFEHQALLGDATEIYVLERAGIARPPDIVAALTGDDEDNLIICQLAKEKYQLRGRQLAAQHSHSLEHWYAHVRALGVGTV